MSRAKTTAPVRPTNKTGFKGVCKNPRGKGYWATVERDRKGFILGRYATPEEAAIAYDKAVRQLSGTNAAYNFPSPGEKSARPGIDPQIWNLPDVKIRPFTSRRISKSGFRGVKLKRSKYKASFYHDGKTTYSGPFDSAIEAARAYDAIARSVLGDKAKVNFTDGDGLQPGQRCRSAAQ